VGAHDVRLRSGARRRVGDLLRPGRSVGAPRSGLQHRPGTGGVLPATGSGRAVSAGHTGSSGGGLRAGAPRRPRIRVHAGRGLDGRQQPRAQILHADIPGRGRARARDTAVLERKPLALRVRGRLLRSRHRGRRQVRLLRPRPHSAVPSLLRTRAGGGLRPGRLRRSLHLDWRAHRAVRTNRRDREIPPRCGCGRFSGVHELADRTDRVHDRSARRVGHELRDRLAPPLPSAWSDSTRT